MLSHNQLRGMPSGLSELQRLALLDLSHNQLSGLPAGLSRLTSLRHLLLSHNKLGALPVDLETSGLQSIEAVELNENQLTRLALSSPTLQTLQAANNRLVTIELRGCTSLRELTASHNQLQEFPAGISALPALATIDVGTNKIHVMDAQLVQACTSLTRLDASCNELRDLPPELGTLKLTKLTLHGNPLRTPPSSVLNGPTPKVCAVTKSLHGLVTGNGM